MTIFRYLSEIVLPIFVLFGSIWGFLKLFYRFKSKFLFVTNCQLLNKVMWDAVSKHNKITPYGPEDYAFRPLVLLPESLKEYTKIRNGQKAVLEMINVNNEISLKLIAEVYWIPNNMDPWNNIAEPVFSKIIMRYFGIEMPIYQDETEKNIKDKLTDWEIVKHCKDYLTPTNRVLDGHYQWLMRKKYTYRYFDPFEKVYQSEAKPNNFIEYCGVSMILRKHSIIHIEKD